MENGKTAQYDIIETFCKTHRTGLKLLPSPTGTGKSYAAFCYMADSAITQNYAGDNEEKTERFIFMTNRKKNLDLESVKKIFTEKGYQELFEKECLFLDNNVDSLVKAIKTTKVPDEIEAEEEFQELKKAIHKYENHKNLKRNSERIDAETVKIMEDILEEERKKVSIADRNFRKLIKQSLPKSKESNQKILLHPEKYNEYQWIFDLYPAASFFSKKIILMSVDKFCRPLDPIFISPFILYETKDPFVIENRTILLDECDASKDVFLKMLLDRVINERVDIIGLFSLAHDKLQNIKNLPQEFLLKEDGQSFLGTLEKIRDEFHAIHEKYHLQNANIKLHEAVGDYRSRFLFYDGAFINCASEEKKRCYIVEYDKTKEKLYVNAKEQYDENDMRLTDLLMDINKCIQGLAHLLRDMADSYRKKEEDKLKIQQNNKEAFEFDNVFKSILDAFFLNGNEITSKESYLFYRGIRIECMKIKRDKFDGSFLENGFTLYEFDDSKNHSSRTIIYHYRLDQTPEKILCEIATRYRVIGLSATALVRSNLCNYNLRYLQKTLGDSYVTLSQEEKALMAEYYKEHITGYDKVNFTVDSVSGISDTDLKSFFEFLNLDPERIKNFKLKNDIQKHLYLIHNDIKIPSEKISKESINIFMERYMRAFQMYSRFLTSTCNSMVCFFQKLPKLGDPQFDRNKTKKMFRYISLCIEELGSVFKPVSIEIIGSENFEEAMRKIKNRLAAGERIMIITSYSTFQAGVNGNYSIPEGADLVQIGSRVTTTKDIDAIYMDAPTHLLTNLNDIKDERDCTEALVEAEYLYNNGELSRSNLKFYAKSASQKINNPKEIIKTSLAKLSSFIGEDPEYYSECESLLGVYRKYFVQSIGRISRTTNKNKDILLLIDDHFLGRLYRRDLIEDGILLSPEMEAILSIEKSKDRTYKYDNSLNIANASTYYYTKSLNGLLRRSFTITDDCILSKWNPDDAKQYDLQRCASLQMILPTEEEMKQKCFADGTIDLGEGYETADGYYYGYDSSWNITVTRGKDPTHNIHVSMAGTRSSDFLKWKDFKNYMESLGYQTEFPASRYWPNPVKYQNIYKGAIGEEFGKFFFKQILDLELEELPLELKELFDFRIKDTNIYIDFKNHQAEISGEGLSNEEEIRKVMLKRAGVSKVTDKPCFVIIANCFDNESGKYMITSYDDNNIIVIPTLVSSFEPVFIAEKEAIKAILKMLTQEEK